MFKLMIAALLGLSSLSANPTLYVFASPLSSNSAEQLKENSFLNSSGERALFQELQFSTFHRWIQHLQGKDYVLHLVKGEDLKCTYQILNAKWAKNDGPALELRQFYQDFFGIDLQMRNQFPRLLALTDMMHIDIPNEQGALVKEYCFLYPLLPGKVSHLLAMFQDPSEYFSDEIQEIYRYRGISKQRLWIQEIESSLYIVIYQEITGPVADARRKYLSAKEEEITKKRAMQFSEVTGLSYEELLPRLTSLFDEEVLR